jgi:poly(3-hydroxybutyrate) depolymerase
MKSKQFIQTIILILISNFIFGQEAEKVILSDSDNYYLKFIPKGKPIGVLVIINGGGENPSDVMKQITLHKLAVEKNMIVIFPAINNDTEELKLLDVIFKQLTEKHKVPKDKFILGGLSGGGMLSLTYAETANKGRHNTFIICY